MRPQAFKYSEWCCFHFIKMSFYRNTNICLPYLNFWQIAFTNFISSFSADMVLFATCSQHLDKFENCSRQMDLHFLLLLLLALVTHEEEAESLALLVFSWVCSSSCGTSFQQCVMCQLKKKLNKPDDSASTTKDSCLTPSLSLLSQLLWLWFSTNRTPGSNSTLQKSCLFPCFVYSSES